MKTKSTLNAILSIIILLIFSLTSCKKDENIEENEVPPSPTNIQSNLEVLLDSLYLKIPYLDISDLSSRQVSTANNSVDLSIDMPPIGNQGGENSCYAWATGYYLKTYQEKIKHNYSQYNRDNVMSPIFIFNQLNNGNCSQLSTVPDAFEILKTKGICSLADMPVTTPCSSYPTSYQFQRALSHRISSFFRLRNNDIISQIKYYLGMQKPVVIVLKYNDSFVHQNNINHEYTYNYGPTSLLAKKHALLLVGYDDTRHAMKAINSWGPNWGNNGYCWIDYDMFTNGNSFTGSTVFRAFVAFDQIPNNSMSLTNNINFGSVNVNSSSYIRYFTITNTGNEDVVIENMIVPNDFTLLDGICTIVPPNASKTFHITFNPTHTGSYDEYLEVVTNIANSTHRVHLLGVGVNNQNSSISVSGNLDFGNVQIGNTSNKTLTIHNTGNQSFYVSDIILPYNAYSINWSSGTIPANSSQNVSVTFTPTNAQSYNGTINVISGANSGNGNINVYGTGTSAGNSEISVSGNLDFGNVQIGDTEYRTFTIHNTGNQSFYVSDIILPYNAYSINWSSGTIPANSSQNVSVTFTPTNAQSYNGTINVISGANSGNGNINVYGEGISNTNNEIIPTNNCSTAPYMDTDTEYEINNFETQYLDVAYPIDNESYQNGLVRGFYLSFTVPSNHIYKIKIYDVSNNFDPVIGIKVNCNTGYYNDIYAQQPYKNNNGYGGNEYFYGQFSPNNTYTIRLYHYYGNETPNISFKVKITPY